METLKSISRTPSSSCNATGCPAGRPADAKVQHASQQAALLAVLLAARRTVHYPQGPVLINSAEWRAARRSQDGTSHVSRGAGRKIKEERTQGNRIEGLKIERTGTDIHRYAVESEARHPLTPLRLRRNPALQARDGTTQSARKHTRWAAPHDSRARNERTTTSTVEEKKRID